METLNFYHPGNKFPSLSVTGQRCIRNCKHCQGHFLKSMVDVSTPKKLKKTAETLSSEGANGFLLSGGYDEKGKVPLEGYFEVLKYIKQDTDLLINIHTGLLDEDTASNLKKTEVDVVSFDMIGNRETIEEVYGLNAAPSDFQKSYELLIQNGLETVPHITLGLHGGRIVGEYKALDMVSDCDKLIVNSLVPSHWGRSVSKRDIIEFLQIARDKIDAEMVLGCMRERGRYEIEIEAIELGIDGIVLPSRKTKEWSEKRYDIQVKEVCCSF
ncbi:MAG: radical SAM protein [Thermoplasmatota archaeon]